MAAIILILLKTAAIADLSAVQTHILILAPIWGRWAQLLAIARYPYLKAEGKGAFHRQTLQLPQDLWPSLCLLMTVGIAPIALQSQSWLIGLGAFLSGLALSWGVGAWFYGRLHGMTGDSYGAIVEWTEALMVCGISFLTE
jgi:adenosylcobinamide-GDP ribazoletransferase